MLSKYLLSTRIRGRVLEICDAFHLLAFELMQISSLSLEFFICKKYHFLGFFFFFVNLEREKACDPFGMFPS